MKRPHRSRKPATGFTLIEVIAAMALVMLLVGGIYSIAGGALELSRATGEARLAELRVSNLVELWRRQFENLPPQARLHTDAIDADGAALRIENSTGMLSWNPALADADSLIFAIDDGALVLEQWQGAERLASVALLPEVETCRWEFYDPIETRWVAGEWPHGGRRPQLAAVTLQLSRDPGPQRYVFRVAPAMSLAGEGRPR